MSDTPPNSLYTDDVPNFNDGDVWELMGEFGIDFYERLKGQEKSTDWNIQGCRLAALEKSISWRRIGVERRYVLKNNPHILGYSTTYFDEKTPQFLVWNVWRKNDWVWQIAIHITGKWWLELDFGYVLLGTYQHEILLAGQGKIIQQIYFVVQKKYSDHTEYILKENPLAPAGKIK